MIRCLPQYALATTLLALLAHAPAALAQDVTHPRAMNLPASSFARPDPARLRLELDNGLVTYVARDERAPLTSISVFVGVGTGHGAPGAARALAAALRRGPAGLPPGAFQQQLQAMNAQFRVEQDHEETILHLDVLAEDSSVAMDLLADILVAPAFDERQAGTSAPTPKPSIDYSYSLKTAINLFENELYAGHRFARTATASPERARELHGQFLRAANVTVAVAGDADTLALRRYVRDAFASLPPGEAPRSPDFATLEPRRQRSVLLEDVDRGQGWVVIGQELPVVPREDVAALEVMDYILGAYHLDSRLYRSSRELRGLTNDNSSFLRPGVRGPGSYSFRTYGRPEVVRLLVDVTFMELLLLRDTLVSDDELFVAKGALIDGLYAQRYATQLDAVKAFAHEWLRFGHHERSASYPEEVRAVTRTDVQAMANKYIDPERMIVAVAGPLERIRSAPSREDEPQLSAWGQVLKTIQRN